MHYNYHNAAMAKTTTTTAPHQYWHRKQRSLTTTKQILNDFHLRYTNVIIILILFCLVKNTVSFCPSKCQCNTIDLNYRTSCINADLEDVPIQLNPDTKYINLTLNKIRNVDFTLPFYSKLEVLDLSQNRIETLGQKNFEYQRELRTLNLSHNSITNLSKDAFRGLGNLLVLDLSYNRIEIIHTNSMNNMTSLIELDLTNNLIVSMENDIFKNMISLEILLMQNNQLLDVPTNNLKYLKLLKSLDLSINLIEIIRNESFEQNKELIMLSLSGNVISELEEMSFEGLFGLKHLDIADNNLTVIPTQQLSKLANLTYLSLSGNRFSQIPAVALLNLFHLKELHLDRLDRLIRIDSRAFVDNTYLQIVNLNDNPLFTDLPLRLFHGNPNILEISIQGNNLQTLDAAQFPIDRIQRLYLGGNPLQCNCSILWLWRLVTGNNDDSSSSSNNNNNNNNINNRNNDVVDGPIAAAAISSITTTGKKSSTDSNPNETLNFLKLDIDLIGCDIYNDDKLIRKKLLLMDEAEISCPAHIVTIVCAILSTFVVIMTGASILFYLRFIRKRRQKLLHDRRSTKTIINVHDRILQQQHHQHQHPHHNNHLNSLTHNHHYQHHQQHNQNQYQLDHTQSTTIDKLELERYLAAQQAIANEYHALKQPWELPPASVKDNLVVNVDDEPEHLYEKFDHYEYPDTRQISKPHVVYV